MVPEKAKLVLLCAALACIVNSFFRSDAFRRGANAGFVIQLHEGLACQGRKEELRDECRAALSKALIPAKLSCLPRFRDVFVCQNPEGDTNKHGCAEEYQQLSECIKTHLEPYGFTDEEVIRLLVGQPRQEQQQQEQQLHKSAPTPKQKPSLDVAKEGGEEQAGQMNKPGGEDEGGGKRDGSEGNEGELVSEPPGRGEGPKVEVEKGEKGRGRRR